MLSHSSQVMRSTNTSIPSFCLKPHANIMSHRSKREQKMKLMSLLSSLFGELYQLGWKLVCSGSMEVMKCRDTVIFQ